VTSQPLNISRSKALYEEARQLIPGGMGGIRRPYNFVPGEYPMFLERAQGGYVWDPDGNRFIDMLCSYGPIILGHREPEIDEAVIAQIRERGFCMNLVQPVQNELARKLIEIFPSAQRVILVKTGSDATSSAIRIARAYTGREVVLRCGYHGWHDWCVEVKGGVPAKHYEDVHEFLYNDLESLERLLAAHRGRVAAVILTPVGHPLAHPVQAPAPGFLEGVRRLASEHEAVLIFDEIRTGFRVSLGGAQARYGVVPDLTVVGKAMANGYPISAVLGRADIMDVTDGKVFISSTFFPNSLEMVAALKTIEILERERALDDLWRRGERFLEALRRSVQESGVAATVSGLPPMPFVTFDRDPEGRYKDRRTIFYTEMIRRGVFLAPYHHGYLCCRHSDADLEHVLGAAAESLQVVREKVG
jgi:glutamate-1-semialdehyde aminotransferase